MDASRRGEIIMPEFESSAFRQMINMQKELLQIIVKDTLFHDQIAKACQSVTEYNKSLIESMQPIFDQQNALAQQISSSFIHFPKFEIPESYITQVTKLSDELRNALKSISIPNFEALSKSISELPTETKATLLLLGENGWYLDLDMPLRQLHEIEKELLSKNVADVDKFLIDYYEENLESIETNICKLYPKRAVIISKAFSAHRNGDYELSVPVFLAQSDGICKEKINYFIFRKKDRKPEAAQYVESLAAYDFQRALMAPLTEILPIMKSEKDRGASFTELNRHMVLHGESCDYGTKLFSCKAISLLNYIANVLK
jgi:hypothetical protein